jgi:CRP-like cAMP-binding protein
MPRGIPSEVVEHFRGVPLFASLSTKGLRALVTAATEVDVRAGRTIVREGQGDRDLYVILRGEAAVTKGGQRLATLTVGDFFGEFALLSPQPRSATVTASTDMRLMVLSPREMREVIGREPSLAVRMLGTMAGRVRRNERPPWH